MNRALLKVLARMKQLGIKGMDEGAALMKGAPKNAGRADEMIAAKGRAREIDTIGQEAFEKKAAAIAERQAAKAAFNKKLKYGLAGGAAAGAVTGAGLGLYHNSLDDDEDLTEEELAAMKMRRRRG